MLLMNVISAETQLLQKLNCCRNIKSPRQIHYGHCRGLTIILIHFSGTCNLSIGIKTAQVIFLIRIYYTYGLKTYHQILCTSWQIL